MKSSGGTAKAWLPAHRPGVIFQGASDGGVTMLENLFYREKNLFLQSLHPGVSLVYLGIFLVLSLLFTNPLFLAGLLVVVILAVWAVAGLDSWEAYLRIGLGMAMLIMIINPLVVHAGTTVIWYGPTIPVLGRITVSLEAICYGAAMSVRLLLVISIFCLYNLSVHPDKTLGLLSRFARKSTLIISIATRMLPAMARNQASIREVQTMRGVDFSAGGIRERLRKYSFLLNVLLLSSLEGSLEIAESMQARAFGSGPRTCYKRETWRPRDTFCLLSSLIASGLAIWGATQGIGMYSYYPQLGPLISGRTSIILLAAVLFFLTIPVLLSWGWQHCFYLKSKI